MRDAVRETTSYLSPSRSEDQRSTTLATSEELALTQSPHPRNALPQLPIVTAMILWTRRWTWAQPRCRLRPRGRSWALCGLCAVSPAAVQCGGVGSSPDDHFTSGPDCRVRAASRGRVGCAGGYPTVRTWIEFGAAVEIIQIPSSPDDHFIASPHRRVLESTIRDIGHAGGYPAVRTRIVTPAGI